MSYGLLVAGSKTVAIFDIGKRSRYVNLCSTCVIFLITVGGGSTDVTILRIDDGESQVVTVAGDGECGGTYYDSALLRYLLKMVAKALISKASLSSDGTVSDSAEDIESSDKWGDLLEGADAWLQRSQPALYTHLRLTCLAAKVDRPARCVPRNP